MSTNDYYELIGGILYHTPVDETNALINSKEFKEAKYIADSLLKKSIRNRHVKNIIEMTTEHIRNYMNSPLVDFLYYNVVSYMWWESVAAHNNDLIVIKYFHEHTDISKSRYSEALGVAAKRGYLDIMKYLVDTCGADVNHKYNYALRNAASYGQFEVVKYLVEVHHVDVNIGNITKPLGNAISKRYIDIVKYLVDHGAIITNIDMMYAQRRFNDDVIRYLQERRV